MQKKKLFNVIHHMAAQTNPNMTHLFGESKYPPGRWSGLPSGPLWGAPPPASHGTLKAGALAGPGTHLQRQVATLAAEEDELRGVVPGEEGHHVAVGGQRQQPAELRLPRGGGRPRQRLWGRGGRRQRRAGLAVRRMKRSRGNV